MLYLIISLVLGLIVLTISADQFTKGAAATAVHFGIPQLIIGMVVIGFGTSAPEMLVSALASYEGKISIGIGNALGSNITNTSLILGATALVSPLLVSSKLLRREIPLLFGCCAVAYVMLADFSLTFAEGVILLVTMITVLFLLINQASDSENADDPLSAELNDEIPTDMPINRAILWLVLGLIGLLASSKAIVWGASGIAESYGVSELVIGLTIVALGTSLPELAASIAGALRNQHDLALGNIIGSNMFNILAVIGISGVVGPGEFDSAAVNRDFVIMIVLLLLLLPMTLERKGQRKVARIEGAILVAAFIGYQAYLFMTTTS